MVDTATATKYRSSGANAVIRFTIRENAGKRLMVSAHHAAISSHRVSEALIRELGSAMRDGPPEMASDDFSEFQAAGVPHSDAARGRGRTGQTRRRSIVWRPCA